MSLILNVLIKKSNDKLMAAFVLNTVKSQLPMLIEKFEPVLESSLRSSLRSMKTAHPEESALFLANWTKLDTAVKSELGVATRVGGRRRSKRTKRTHRNRK